MTGNPLDLIFIIIIAFFMITAAIHGFIKEIFGKAAFVVSLLGAVFFTGMLSPMFRQTIANELLCNVAAFLILFVGIFIVMKILQEIFSKIFSSPILKSLDKALGLLLGFAEGMVIISFIMLVIMVQPWFKTESVFDGSIFYEKMCPIISESATVLKGTEA